MLIRPILAYAFSRHLGCLINGCTVANAAGDTLGNGSGLNPGEIAEIACPQTGYCCPKGAMILPWPGDPDRYLLLHMGARYDPGRKLTFGPLYYSLIHRSAGVVSSKNAMLLDGDLEPFTVVRHGNGRDWWIVVADYSTNLYQVFLLSTQEITALPVQAIGPAMSCKRIGSTAFSPTACATAASAEATVSIPHFPAGLYFWALRWPDGNRVAGRLLVD